MQFVWHLPALHTEPVGQTVPQAPQFWPSCVGSTHVPEHEMSGATQPHLPATHEPPAPQPTPHMPQLPGSAVRSTHWPLQSVKPAGQAHFPPLQAWPPEQTLPQPPQFCESVFSFTQLRPHATFGLVQVLTQLEL
jgi:hypothetical protein